MALMTACAIVHVYFIKLKNNKKFQKKILKTFEKCIHINNEVHINCHPNCLLVQLEFQQFIQIFLQKKFFS